MVTTFIILQFLDAILTYIGLELGYSEGNPILAYWMRYSVIITLITAKIFAVVFVLYLEKQGYYKAIIALNVYYILLAVIPWFIFISMEVLFY